MTRSHGWIDWKITVRGGMAEYRPSLHHHRHVPILLGSADAARQSNGFTRLPIQQADIEQAVVAARAALAPNEWGASYNLGFNTPVEDALENACSSSD